MRERDKNCIFALCSWRSLHNYISPNKH